MTYKAMRRLIISLYYIQAATAFLRWRPLSERVLSCSGDGGNRRADIARPPSATRRIVLSHNTLSQHSVL